jgi:hypothetical protein
VLRLLTLRAIFGAAAILALIGWAAIARDPIVTPERAALAVLLLGVAVMALRGPGMWWRG